MKVVQGWAFPEADEFMVKELAPNGTYQLEHLETALRYVTDHRTAIDGGAHVGTWSKVMSQHFDHVIAVEPSPDTFACLMTNLAGCPNVTCRPVALGAQPGTVSMRLDAENAARQNTGARYAQPGGTIPVETIDSWGLPDCGFLKLDVEGSELVALEGARQTLRHCRPIVLFEAKWLWTRHFRRPKHAVRDLLTQLGYRQLATISRDQVWGPR